MSKLKHKTPTTKKQWKRQFRNTMKHMLLVFLIFHDSCIKHVFSESRIRSMKEHVHDAHVETSKKNKIEKKPVMIWVIHFQIYIGLYSSAISTLNFLSPALPFSHKLPGLRMQAANPSAQWRVSSVHCDSLLGAWGTCLLYVKTLNQKN